MKNGEQTARREASDLSPPRSELFWKESPEAEGIKALPEERKAAPHQAFTSTAPPGAKTREQRRVRTRTGGDSNPWAPQRVSFQD